MKKLTYLLDGNFYLHKTLSVCGAFDEKTPMFLKTDSDEKKEKDKNSLIHKLTMDLCSDIRKVSSIIDEIIITMDDYSWRNDFFQDKRYESFQPTLDTEGNLLNLEGDIVATSEAYEAADEDERRKFLDLATLAIDYKGHRVKDKSFNWSFVYQIFEEFLQDLQNIAKIKWVRINGCEGDDLIFAICTHYVAKGKSVMIYSGDNDLKQLINHDTSNNAFVIHHKKTEKKIVMSNETAKYLLSIESIIKDKFNGFAQTNGINLVVEDPFDIVFTKILTGDDGDNVKAVISEPRQVKSGKTKGQWKDYKIGKREIDKIKNELYYTKYSFLDFFNHDFIVTLANSILRNFKPNYKFTVSNVCNNIEINRDLMFLHKNCLPQSIYESMVDWIDQNADKNDLVIKDMFSYKALLEKNPHYTKNTEETQVTSANLFKHLGL